MKHRNITSAALAVALIATLLFGFGRGQGADVKKQAGKTAAQFDVPKEKDSKFYSELTDKLFHEFGEASRSIETQEEFKLLAKQLADALKTVYLYTKRAISTLHSITTTTSRNSATSPQTISIAESPTPQLFR